MSSTSTMGIQARPIFGAGYVFERRVHENVVVDVHGRRRILVRICANVDLTVYIYVTIPINLGAWSRRCASAN